MLDTVKEKIKAFFDSRLVPVAVVYLILFSMLINRLFNLQIVNSDSYEEAATNNTTHTREIKATRGNIYDCKGRLLAYNKLSYNVTFEDMDALSNLTTAQKNAMIYNLINIIEKNGGSIDVEFYIEYNQAGKLVFNIEGTKLLQFKADVLYKKNYHELTQSEKDMTAQDIYEHLRYSTDVSTPGFSIDKKYDDKMALKIMAIRYAMFINRYTKYIPITIAKNVNDVTVASIKENSDVLPGVDITQDTTRVYNKSKYFAHMLGYTGAISSEKLEELKKDDSDTEYTTDDQIGISGLESTYENYLKGKKGSETLLTNESTSRVISVSNVKSPTAGNDLYLTIDAKLQEECYKLLEEHIAGILISNIVNGSSAGSRGVSSKDIKVPIYDVYNALISNNIIDVSRFTDDDASSLEKSTYSKFKRKQSYILKVLKHDLASDSTVTSENDDKYQEGFLDYFYTVLKNNDIVMTDEVDTDSDVYKKYVDGKISLSKYLQYALSKNWIDTSQLNIGKGYYSTEEIYNKLVNYTFSLLKDDKTFIKKVYSYMIYHYELSGTDCCLLLFDQGDIKYNENEYNMLKAGATSPYSFLIKKIKKLQITPGQLGLDPCSGSLIVTDVNTGNVKAMVTYPSYDNNKMANQVDSDYFYNYLTQCSSSPLLNRPTQQKLAPGSTFKIVSAVAGMEEGVISPSTLIYDHTVFDKIWPSPRDWSNVSHGNINVSTALEVSCNYFFYTVGYLLSGTTNGAVNNDTGLAKLKKYASMFGLTSKSGVEVNETSPNFSTNDAVRSAIGQAKHSYAPIQLSRYVTTIANSGTCYNLTLLDKIKSVNGKVILDNSAKVKNKVKIAQSTWDAVHKGMYLVVNGSESSISSFFTNLKTTVAGKTGTAQQTTYHANHAYFISYAPYNNPKISVTCVIPNGYASANAAETASDVYKYYFSKKKVSGNVSINSYAATD